MTKLGIDFGTSYTKITYIQGSEPNSLPRDSRLIEVNNSIATALAYSLETSDIWVGKHAIEKIGNSKSEFYNYFRKHLPLQEKDLTSSGWTGSKTPKEVTYDYFDKILKGNPSIGKIEKAVISVPDFWYQDAKNTGPETLSGILEKLNINVSHIYSEPICAAAAYIWQAKEFSKDRRAESSYNLLIIDMGGYTMDITLCEVKNDVVTVISRYGEGRQNSSVAGTTFDEKCVLRAYDNQERGKVIDVSPNDFQKLRYALEQEKNDQNNNRHILNPRIQSLDLKNSPIYKFHANNKQFSITISEVFQIFEPIKQGIIELLNLVNNDVKQKSLKIDKTLIIGGFGVYPLVKKTISEYLENNIGTRVIDDLEFDIGKRSHAISYGAFYLAEDRFEVIEPYQSTIGIKTKQVNNFNPLFLNLPIIEANKEHAGMTSPRFLETSNGEKIIVTVSEENKTNTIPIYLQTYGTPLVDIPIQDTLPPGNYFIGFQIDRLNTITLIFVNQDSKEKKEYRINQLEFKSDKEQL